MKTTLGILLGTLLSTAFASAGEQPSPSPAQAPVQAGRTEDEKAIRAAIDSFTKAFGKGDAKSIAAMFTEQGEAIDSDGLAIRGRQALEAHYTALFSDNPGEKIETTIDLIHFLTPEVVRQDGHSRLSPVDNSAPITSRYTATFVKSQGRWLVASIRDLEDPMTTHQGRLQELEWMIGDWIEETGDALVVNTIAWSEDKHFLIRNFEIHVAGKPDLKATQRIGWDPLSKQIKSWIFDSKGGFGDGFWTRNGDHWIIKSTGVRPDGQTTSATQILTRMHKDRLLWKSTDRTIGSETRNDIQEFTMVRKPPEPK